MGSCIVRCRVALPASNLLTHSAVQPLGRHAVRARRWSRWHAVKPLAGHRQVSAAVPPPQPPVPPSVKAPPPWAVGAGVVAVAAAAIRIAWANRAKRQGIATEPTLAPSPVVAAAVGAAAVDAAAEPAAAVDAGAAETAWEAAAGAGPDTSALEAARAAMQQAVQPAAAASDAGNQDVTGQAGPMLLDPQPGGAMEVETATLSLEQLQKMATELYLLIQRMEVQLQEVVGELAELLPEAGQALLDELSQQMEVVEEQLALFKGRADAEERAMAAERAYSDLQWRMFELVTEGAAERQRRSLRSLLFDLTTQRHLLRQVEQQEALRLSMREVEQRIAALLDMEQQPAAATTGGDAAAATAPPPPRTPSSSTMPLPAASRRLPAPPASAAGATQLRLVGAGTSLPHPAKAATGGEDAFFLSSSGLGAIGIADGVGGWAAKGIDPSLYPRALMSACEEVLRAGWGEGRLQQQQQQEAAGGPPRSTAEGQGEAPLALEVLQEAYQRAEEPGSSTALLCTLLPGGRLSVANLGDCELKVLRGGTITFSTQIQEHEWNMPLQLSSASFYDCGSRPKDADVCEVPVAPGDLLVLGSDGLWDNLWEVQLEEAVVAAREQYQYQTEVDMAEQLAEQLARAAHRQSLDPTFPSPFATERQRRAAATAGTVESSLFAPGTGGKPDDVTVVVAVVAAS